MGVGFGVLSRCCLSGKAYCISCFYKIGRKFVMQRTCTDDKTRVVLHASCVRRCRNISSFFPLFPRSSFLSHTQLEILVQISTISQKFRLRRPLMRRLDCGTYPPGRRSECTVDIIRPRFAVLSMTRRWTEPERAKKSQTFFGDCRF